MAPLRRRMLVPLDGSPLAEVALSEALTLARIPRSEVILLQVIPPIADLIHSGKGVGIDEQWESRKARALQYLNGICDGPAWRGVQTQVAVETGRPAETILDFADRYAVERIIMATHGQTGLGRWVFGSVADKVLRAVDRTVVLVYVGRPPTSDRLTSSHRAE